MGATKIYNLTNLNFLIGLLKKLARMRMVTVHNHLYGAQIEKNLLILSMNAIKAGKNGPKMTHQLLKN